MWMLLCAALGACAFAPTGTTPFAYGGSWSYSAQQEIPGTASI
jgi:hypothetical protein